MPAGVTICPWCGSSQVVAQQASPAFPDYVLWSLEVEAAMKRLRQGVDISQLSQPALRQSHSLQTHPDIAARTVPLAGGQAPPSLNAGLQGSNYHSSASHDSNAWGLAMLILVFGIFAYGIFSYVQPSKSVSTHDCSQTPLGVPESEVISNCGTPDKVQSLRNGFADTRMLYYGSLQIVIENGRVTSVNSY